MRGRRREPELRVLRQHPVRVDVVRRRASCKCRQLPDAKSHAWPDAAAHSSTVASPYFPPDSDSDAAAARSRRPNRTDSYARRPSTRPTPQTPTPTLRPTPAPSTRPPTPGALTAAADGLLEGSLTCAGISLADAEALEGVYAAAIADVYGVHPDRRHRDIFIWPKTSSE